MDVRIRFEPSQREVQVPAGTTLIEAAQRAGLPIASTCGADGACGRCGLEILAGGETLSEATACEVTIKRRNAVDEHLRLACRITVSADLVVTAQYW